MDERHFFVTSEVARMLGVSADRIVRAHRSGRLPEPARAGHHRVYTAAEVAAAMQFFSEEGGKNRVA